MTPWDSATTALSLLAIDPGLGGMVIRARAGPVRDALLDHQAHLFGKSHRLHPTMTAECLDEAIDVAASLGAGRLTLKPGLLNQKKSAYVLGMAERSNPYLVARLSGKLDARDGSIVLAVDEGADPDEAVSEGLSDRLAFHVALDDVAMSEIGDAPADADLRDTAYVEFDPDLPEQLVVLAVALGITSLRAPGFALRCAKAHAVLADRKLVATEEVEAAVALVFAPRATRLPSQEDDVPPDSAPDPETDADDTGSTDQTAVLPDDILLEAVKAALPPDLLARLGAGKTKSGKGSGSGKKRIGNRRGRPLPASGAHKTPGARIDLMATLRAAVPWQTLRKRAQPDRMGAIIFPADLRYKRYQELSDRVLIFAVDASGSSAMARLGEAKGAIELLLSEAYARRDHVALISFRGAEADIMLPPTRSLVQTKRRLAALAGGGGTPLAAGLFAAHRMARLTLQKGMTPTLVLLTDGRSNVALDGSADRAQAATDVADVARILAEQQVEAIVIDTGRRPEQSLKQLADGLLGSYLTLPRADAQSLSQAVSASLSD